MKSLQICLSTASNTFVVLVILLLMLNDNRWSNFHHRLEDNLGGPVNYATMVGTIIFCCCPLIASVIKFITAIMQNYSQTNDGIAHVVAKAWSYFHFQTITDLNYSRLQFGKMQGGKISWKYAVLMVLCTALKYSVPTFALLFGMNNKSELFYSTPLKLPFLLDNGQPSSVGELVQRRRDTAGAPNLRSEIDDWCDGKDNSDEYQTVTRDVKRFCG